MTRLLTVLALLLATLSFTPAAQSAPEAPTADPVACDWHQTFAEEVLALDGNFDAWRVASLDEYAVDGNEPFGRVSYDDMIASINPDVPCETLPSVLKHEWMHLQQGRTHGDGGPDSELVADCGSQLLGSDVTPYISPDSPAYLGPCQLEHVVAALKLVLSGPDVERA